MDALCLAQAITEGSFSMAMTEVQRSDKANAIALPPAPANMSIIVVLDDGVVFAMSEATWLRDVSSKRHGRGLDVRSHWFGSDTKPCIISHVNALVVL